MLVENLKDLKNLASRVVVGRVEVKVEAVLARIDLG